MSSILTNEGAMMALYTLRNVNSGLADLQVDLGTGKRVANARDNSAVWAISKTMQSDIKGFRQLASSLALGQSTLSVGRQAAASVTDVLTEMKGKIVAAQEYNVDREKIQTDVVALRDQVDAIVAAAQFNGQNLLQNRDTTEGSGQINVLSSVIRSGTAVTSEDITVSRHDLSTQSLSIAVAGGSYTSDAVSATLSATQSATLSAAGLTVEIGASFSISIYGTDGDDSTFSQADLRSTAGSSQSRAEMASSSISYVARDGDTITDVLSALVTKFKGFAAERGISKDVLELSRSGSDLVATSSVTTAADTIDININTLESDAVTTVGGRLDLLNEIDVTTNEGADKAMAIIDDLIEVAVDASADLGSDQGRMEQQEAFISNMADALKSGVGTIVDADLTASSARLQALQVQQQLAVQALSIANQAPSALLGLFR